MKVQEFCQNQYDAPPPTKRRLYGVEVEVEQAGEHPSRQWLTAHKWRVTEDGSLRNNGLEFVSSPVTLRTAMHSYEALCEKAREFGYVANARTGIHVHADMRDLEVTQVAGVVAAYAAFEPLFFDLVGREREENIYCVPWYRAPEEGELIATLVTGDYARLRDACKYSALYLMPLRKFGTIEFRAAPTWVDPEPMRRWMQAINRCIRWGMTQTPQSVLEACNTDPNTLVKQVFGRVFDHIEDPESLMDGVDSLGTVATMLPCTYKVGGWELLAANGESKAFGYHKRPRNRREAGVIMDDVDLMRVRELLDEND